YTEAEQWISLVAPEEPGGTELVLHLADETAKAFQAAIRAAGRPSLALVTDDCQRDYQALRAKGVLFTMPPTQLGHGGTDAVSEAGSGTPTHSHKAQAPPARGPGHDTGSHHQRRRPSWPGRLAPRLRRPAPAARRGRLRGGPAGLERDGRQAAGDHRPLRQPSRRRGRSALCRQAWPGGRGARRRPQRAWRLRPRRWPPGRPVPTAGGPRRSRPAPRVGARRRRKGCLGQRGTACLDEAMAPLPVADRWFETTRVDDTLIRVIEPHVVPLMRCNIWFVTGRDRDVIVDTGRGVSSVTGELAGLINKPVIAVATHGHDDHIGGHHEFADVRAHHREAGLLRCPPLRSLSPREAWGAQELAML